ncbi:MAG: hypothetical protein K6T61_06505 [Bryobacteraceae bacterium]|nr:hypothetical protein [Bryobacteraceae bacterium]
MLTEWLLHPLTAWLCAAIGILLCLVLFFSMARDLKRRAVATEQRQAELEKKLDEARAGLEELRTQVRQLAESAERVASLPVASSGLNLNKRGMALRMHRRGEPAGRIAAALGLPEGEVEFLLKVHRLSADGPRNASAAES